MQIHRNLEVDLKILAWAWSKMGVATLVSGHLKLAVPQEGINRVSWCVDKNSGNLKVTLIIFALC